MYKITINALSCCCYPSNNDLTHVSLEIEDLESKRIFSVSFTPQHLNAGIDGQIVPNVSIISTVVLYNATDINLDDFKKDLNRKFNNHDRSLHELCSGDELCRLTSFQFCCHNCSDAALFALNYFFPVQHNKKIEAAWQCYKLLTFPCCLATLGCSPFFASPPFTNGPGDIMRKAQFLARTHGDIKKIAFFPKIKSNKKIGEAKICPSPSEQRMS